MVYTLHKYVSLYLHIDPQNNYPDQLKDDIESIDLDYRVKSFIEYGIELIHTGLVPSLYDVYLTDKLMEMLADNLLASSIRFDLLLMRKLLIHLHKGNSIEELKTLCSQLTTQNSKTSSLYLLGLIEKHFSNIRRA